MRHPTIGLRQHACFLALAIGLAVSAPAFAQEAQQADDSEAPDAEAIIITGSRIASGFDRPTPVAVLGADRIEARGTTNLGDALNELPAFRATNTPASTGLGAAAGYVGGRILDLRGLGAVRTLTLVDGKRFVPSTTQATVDTNMIPSVLLSRAEVVTGGASAVYGSDAVSGVVNLLIDKRFTGYKANGQVGFSQYGDNFTRQFGAAGGWDIGSTLHVIIGGEYRSDQVKGDADALSKSLAFFTGNGSAISGKIEVAEVYGEAEVPLLRDMTAFQELSLNGAIRRTHYKRSSATVASSTVDVTTWKIGGVWAPIDAIRFRVTRSRDIRAPNVSELFGPFSSASGILNDPARGGQQTVVPITNGSNPNLRPEKADTLTVGVVLQPTGDFLGRFRASVDYYSMKIKDAISTLGQQNIVTRCSQGDALSCSLVTRDAQGIITNVRDTVQNVNQLNAKGIDFEVSYRQPIGAASNLNLSLLASNMIDLITVDAVGPVERAGQTGLRGGTPPGIPDWTLDANAGLDLGEMFSFNTHVRWINKGFYNAAFIGPDQAGFSVANPASTSTNSMPGRTYVDILGTVKVPLGDRSKASVYFGIDNLFNVDPPNFPGANGSGNNVLFNPVGRMYKAGVRASF